MLEAKNISVGYGSREVLRDVSMFLRSGEIVGLLGANGAGKSTLIRALNGTVPVTSGEIFIEEEPISRMSRRRIARKISVVAQENETRFPITVLEFVLSGRFAYGNAYGWETKDDDDHARAALADCDLDNYGDRRLNQLSGGERQRAVLARAVAADTPILLLDEPTANLDIAHQAMMFRLVRERCKTRNMSAVVITHDLNLASEFADRILLLHGERIAAEGTADDVLNKEIVREVFGINVLLDTNPASQRVRVTPVY
jgi:ABC-type cobalamin/Fe3+-siderophores transport system ATPase subunit